MTSRWPCILLAMFCCLLSLAARPKPSAHGYCGLNGLVGWYASRMGGEHV